MSKYKKRERIPVVDTLIDLAGAAAMDFIAYEQRKKYKGKRAKIDPYKAAGIAMGMGKLNDTEDLLELGGFLGMMGAFDPDDDEIVTNNARTNKGTYSAPKVNKNKYAWRMNCEDGSVYGIYPENYETRAEYNAALSARKGFAAKVDSNNSNTIIKPIKREEVEISDCFIICKVSRLDNGLNQYFKTNGEDLKIGDIVIVPIDSDKTSEAIVLSIEKHTELTTPIPLTQAKSIIGKKSDRVI